MTDAYHNYVILFLNIFLNFFLARWIAKKRIEPKVSKAMALCAAAIVLWSVSLSLSAALPDSELTFLLLNLSQIGMATTLSVCLHLVAKFLDLNSGYPPFLFPAIMNSMGYLRAAGCILSNYGIAPIRAPYGADGVVLMSLVTAHATTSQRKNFQI